VGLSRSSSSSPSSSSWVTYESLSPFT
jgi:hypothetical protein